MGTRGNEAIMKELAKMSEKMLTKDHFDNEMKTINEKLSVHDERIEDIDQRLVNIETTITDNSNGVYEELYEREARKNNIIIFKLPEQNTTIQRGNKSDLIVKEKEIVKDLFADMKLIDTIDDDIRMRVFRIGKLSSTNTNPRPLKVVLFNSEITKQVFGAAKNLKGNPKWKKLSISPDLTKMQQKLGKKKRNDLLKDAVKKNNERSSDDIDKGVEYKVTGNYGFYNLRVTRVISPARSDNEED